MTQNAEHVARVILNETAHRIGTTDPARLVEALQREMQERPEHAGSILLAITYIEADGR